MDRSPVESVFHEARPRWFHPQGRLSRRHPPRTAMAPPRRVPISVRRRHHPFRGGAVVAEGWQTELARALLHRAAQKVSPKLTTPLTAAKFS
jgi:hypothetical protein